MQILRYFPILGKGALKGTFSLKVDKWGVIINDMKLFEKEGRKWISFPQKIIKTGDKSEFFPLLQFEQKSHMSAFSDKVLSLLAEFVKRAPIEANAEIKPSQDPQYTQMEAPF